MNVYFLVKYHLKSHYKNRSDIEFSNFEEPPAKQNLIPK